jgi:hypothetical protein
MATKDDKEPTLLLFLLPIPVQMGKKRIHAYTSKGI